MSEDRPFEPLPTGSLAAPSPRRLAGWAVPASAFVGGLVAMALLFSLHPFGLGQPPAPAVEPSAAIPARTVPASAPAGDISALSVREQALSAQLDQLAQRLMAIEAGARNAGAYATRAESVMVTQAVRRALSRGQPLGYLESQLTQRFGDTQPQAVAAVVAAAHNPVTLEDLRSALDPIASRLVTGNPEDSWWTIFRREVGDLVVLREDSAPSPRPSDRLKRARRALDAGQVEAALAEVVRLPGARSADGWTAAAKRYVDAQHALATLEQAALSVPAIR